MDETDTESERWRLSRYAPPDLQNPSREEIYDEMTAHIKGDKPASGASWYDEEMRRLREQIKELQDEINRLNAR